MLFTFRKPSSIVIAFILFIVVESIAIASPMLIPYRKNDKWGYCTKSKKMIIDPVYDQVSFFDDNAAWVQKDKMWALINKEGKALTPFKYGIGYEFLNTDFCVNGLIRVVVNNKFGFVNNKGEEIIPCVYDRASPFEKGSARVMKDGLWALINTKGKEISSGKFDEIYDFHEDIAIVRIGDKIGYISRNGRALTPLVYDTRTFDNNNCKGDFHNGYARVCKSDSCGCINKKGDVVIPLRFKFIDDFVSKYIVVCNYNMTRSLYSLKGQHLFKESYYYVKVSEYGFWASEWKNQYLIHNEYNFKGKLIKINSLPDSIEFSRLNESLYLYYSNERNVPGIVTRRGKILFPENYFKYVRINDNMIEVSKSIEKSYNEGIGFLNKDGKITIPPTYKFAYKFVDDNIILRDQKDMYLVMDKTGRLIIHPNYNDIRQVSNKYYLASVYYEGVKDGSASVMTDGYVSPEGVEYWEDTRPIEKRRK